MDDVDVVFSHVRFGQAQSLPDVQQPGSGAWRPVLQGPCGAVVTLPDVVSR